MKLHPIIGSLSLAMILSAGAQVTETKTEKKTTASSDGSVQQSTTTTTTFNPEVQTKVVQYFDTYKASPHGLPPEWAARIKVEKLPSAWTTTRIAPGTILTEDTRPYLVEAPPALVKILPPAQTEVRYYVAGGNVVAIDKTYKVVDSVRIPTVTVAPAPAPTVVTEEVTEEVVTEKK